MGRWRAFRDDSTVFSRQLSEANIDAIVTDVPYGHGRIKDIHGFLSAWLKNEDPSQFVTGKGFMGKIWDASPPSPSQWREHLRVLKPGGYAAICAGNKKPDLIGLSLRLAGFEIHETVLWVYGCLSEDTEVLTAKGWVRYHSAIAEDILLCYDISNNTFQWEKPTCVHAYEYDDTAYRIQGDNTDQLVSKNHRCIVEREGALSFKYAENLPREQKVCVPILEDMRGLLEALCVPQLSTDETQEILPLVPDPSSTPTTQKEDECSTDRHGQAGLPGVRKAILESACLGEKGQDQLLQPSMQWKSQGQRLGETCTQRSSCMVGCGRGELPQEDDRGGQSGLEGRNHTAESKRRLQGMENQVYALSAAILLNGPEGRLRDGVSFTGSSRVRAVPEKDRSSSSQEPQSRGQPLGEPGSVRKQSGSQTVRASRFTTTDLAQVIETHYKGLMWCPSVTSGAFVARRNGQTFITGNSGFPKSYNISKALDKLAGVEREVVGRSARHVSCKPSQRTEGLCGSTTFQETEGMGAFITAPATDEAKLADGYGTALKPATEIIYIARKPLKEKTYAKQFLANRCGGLHIGACRIGTSKNVPASVSRTAGNSLSGSLDGSLRRETGNEGGHNPNIGRWPANLILDEEAGRLLGQQSGVISSGKPTQGKENRSLKGVGDTGTAARFFYCAKSSRKERTLGAEGLPIHPTSKPINLMRWLVRLVTPPVENPVIYDPFCGGGTTGCAAMLEGCRFIGVEMDGEYIKTIEARLKYWEEVSHEKTRRTCSSEFSKMQGCCNSVE